MVDSHAQVVTLYMTTSDEAEAHAIASRLLEEHLIACANILPGGRSVYRWQGKIADGPECYTLLKTCADRVPQAMARIGEMHSYDTPCIGVWPWTDGSGPFMAWVREETR